MASRRVMSVAVAIVGASLIAGCADDDVGSPESPASTPTPSTPTPTSAPATPPPELTFGVVYPRYLRDTPRLAVTVANSGGDAVTVTGVALRADHFEHLEPEAKHSSVRPGSRVDIQVGFGPMRNCDDPGPLDAVVQVDLVLTPDDTSSTYSVSVDPAPLDEIHRIECGRQLVNETIELSFSAGSTTDGPIVHTSIEGRVLGAPRDVIIERIRGTEVFAMQPSGELSGASDDGPTGDDALTLPIPVEIYVTRCDEHVLSASTRTFEFKVWVGIDGDESHMLALAPPEELHTELRALVAACVAARDED